MKIKFFQPDQSMREVEASGQTSVMEVAMDNGIDGILAICRGSAACGTCHVYVGEAWRDRLGKSSETESEVLELVPSRWPNSRLSCQIPVDPTLDGLELFLPSNQL